MKTFVRDRCENIPLVPPDTFQCKHLSLQKGVCKSAKPACKTIIPAPPTDARENRVLSPWLTHSCVFSQHPRGFIIPAFIPLSPAHRGCPRSRGTRRLVRVAEQRGSMSSSGLNWERKCGASGEGNQGKSDAGGEGT